MNTTTQTSKKDLGAGIITIAVLSLISGAGELFLNFLYLSNYAHTAQRFNDNPFRRYDFPSKTIIIFTFILYLVFIIGTALILCKQSIGADLYFISTAGLVICILIAYGITLLVLKPIILPIFMWIFIGKRKDL